MKRDALGESSVAGSGWSMCRSGRNRRRLSRTRVWVWIVKTVSALFSRRWAALKKNFSRESTWSDLCFGRKEILETR